MDVLKNNPFGLSRYCAPPGPNRACNAPVRRSINVRTKPLLERDVFSLYAAPGSGSVGTGGAASVCCLDDGMPYFLTPPGRLDTPSCRFAWWPLAPAFYCR